MKLIFLVAFILIRIVPTVRSDSEDDTSGRAIVFWNGGTIKFIVGWTIPIHLHVPFVTLFIHSIQAAYPAISNATQLTDLLQQGIAKGVRFTKRSVYYLVDRLLSRYGYFNRQCLTRFICEISQLSIGHTLAGELLQYVLKPEEGGKYEKAWKRGMSTEECEQFYFCPYANYLLSQLTTVEYH